MNKLKHLRTEKNLTQSALCEELKKMDFYISRSTYSKYETGSIEMTAETIILFARFFGTSADFILGITDFKF